jgi:hypothetical protein
MAVAINPGTGLILMRQRCTEAAVTAARALPRDELLGRLLDDLIADIVADTVPQWIELDLDAHEVSADEATIDEKQGNLLGPAARSTRP